MIPAGVDVDALDVIARAKGRAPQQVVRGSPQALVFVPDLTPAEETVLEGYVAATKAKVAIDADDLAALTPDLAIGRQFLSLANPSTADAVAALRALWRVVGTLLS